MLALYSQGISLAEIGRRMGRHHTSVKWWIDKVKKQGCIIEKVVREFPMDFLSKIKPKAKSKKQLEIERKEIIKEQNLCVVCLGPKEPGWENTNYCSLKCYKKANERKNKGDIW